MLEVHIDIRWFGAVSGHKARKEQPVFHWVDGGDTEAVAHGRVSCRTAALAEDLLRACPRDAIMDGHEVFSVPPSLNKDQPKVSLLFKFGRQLIAEKFPGALE